MSESSSLPLFSTAVDPGPSFADVLRRLAPHQLPGAGIDKPSTLEIPHGTTVVAIRFAGGVIMAGDRRATAGYMIASRRIEKVFPADGYSGGSIAGAAGPANEMVKGWPLVSPNQYVVVVPTGGTLFCVVVPSVSENW
jgi:proteasome beta subunit